MKLLKILLSVFLVFLLVGCIDIELSNDEDLSSYDNETNEIYTVLNHNEPTFSKKEYTTKSYIHLSELDRLGRTGEALACLSKETMPKKNEQRETINMIKPSGWKTKRYDKELVEGKMLYNRCHQIAWCLSALNAEERNLMTGTRSFNVDGMLPFENMVADYIKETGHHVLYRSTPEFYKDELVARSLHLEAASVEDDEIRFNVRIYNKQDGITINYQTGESYLSNEKENIIEETSYVINKNSLRFHRPSCSSVKDMKAKNKEMTSLNRDELIEQGYVPCGACAP